MKCCFVRPDGAVKPLLARLCFASTAICSIGLVAVVAPAQAFQVVAPNLPYGGKSQFEWAKSFWVNVLDAPDAGNPQYPASDGSSLYMINQPESPVFSFLEQLLASRLRAVFE